MPDHPPIRYRMAAARWKPAFRGRAHERRVLDGLLDRVRSSESAVLVIRGEAGIGKTEPMARPRTRRPQAADRFRSPAWSSEMESPFAALHQFCAPMLWVAWPRCPCRRSMHCGWAFGLATGPAPWNRFVVGLGAPEPAGRECRCPAVGLALLDDAQWLDEFSSQVLGLSAGGC